MKYIWVRLFDDDACWRVMSLCYVFSTYSSVYLPLSMFVSLDVQVLESDASDLSTIVEPWRSFPNLEILVLKMAENL